MDTLWQDVKYGARLLARSPGFTAVAVLTLALGIGANTAIFSLINAVLLRPLPYHQPERLVEFEQNQSWPDMRDLGEQGSSFAALGGYTKTDFNYTDGPEAERIRATVVTGNLFSLLGAEAALGRVFLPEEDQPDGDHLVLLSHGFWQSYLGGAPDVVGTTVSFSGTPHTVIGVMPAGFQLPQDRADVWALLRVELWDAAQHRGVHFLRAFGRLEPEVSLAQAQAEFDAIAQRLARLYPEENTDIRFVAVPLHQFSVRNVRTAFLVLFGAVGFVLLIACINVANLLLSRGVGRQRELAVRAALGAGWTRLFRQLLTESALLGLLGSIAGLLVATWLTELAVRLGPAEIPRLEQAGLDPVVLAFTLGLGFLTALLFGVLPAAQTAKLDLHDSLKEGGRTSSGSRRRRLRSLLVASEVALAFILLLGAGLLLRSFYHLQKVELGFRADSLLTANLNLPWQTYREIPKRLVFLQDVLERVRALPGVETAAIVTEQPFGSGAVHHNFVIEGRPPLAPGTEPSAYYRGVSPNYFQTMEIPLLQGRNFTAEDRADAPLVAIINERMAREFFPGQDPIGQRLRWVRRNPPYSLTIVGVAGNIRSFNLVEEDAPAVYVPFLQEKDWWRTWMNITVRTSVSPMSLAAALKHEVAQVDKNIPAADIQPMEWRMAESVAGRRFEMFLLGLFAVLALSLAAVGIYGVISYSVAQRTHEMGIRLALGAGSQDIFRLVVGDGLLLALLGIVVGVGGALGLARYLRTLLFGVSTLDVWTYGAVSLLVGAVAFLACWLPARRATRVDPMVALRYE